MVIWAFVILVVLMIPLLAIVIDSELGRALARRISGDSDQASDAGLGRRVEQLEAEVRYLTESLESLREEATFLQSILEDKPGSRSLPPGD